MKRHAAFEGALFLLTMAALACLALVGFGAVIVAGNWLLIALFRGLVSLGLWRPAALALAVMATALFVYAFFYSAGRLKRPKMTVRRLK